MRHLCTLLALFALTTWASAQTYYGYCPQNFASEDIGAQGTGNSGIMESAICLNPTQDPVVAALKGQQIKGLRVYIRNTYSTSTQASNRYVWYCESTDGTKSIDTQANKTTCKFYEGWNDVNFTTPVTIGDAPLYLGVRVYETFGSSHPFVYYAQGNANHAFLINPNKNGWQEGSGEGIWLMEAIMADDDVASSALKGAAYVSFGNTPLTVTPNTLVDGTLYVHNQSAEPLKTLTFESSDAHGVSHTYTLDLSENPIAPFDGRSMPYQVYSPSKSGTSVPLMLRATQVNGNKAQGMAGTNTFYVMEDAFVRVPLVEEFTSQSCVNCPFMVYYLDEAMENYRAKGNPLLYVAHHAGFASDIMTRAEDTDLLYLFNGEGTYNPAVMYDRRVFAGSTSPINSAKTAETTDYDKALEAVKNQPALADVQVNKSADGTKVTVSGFVNRDLVAENIPVYLTCYLIENGVKPTGAYFQKGLEDAGIDGAPADLAEKYRHNGIIRHVFTSKSLGDLLDITTTDAGCSYEVTYDYPTTFSPLPLVNADNTDIIAFVHLQDKNVMQNNYILNAGSLRLTTGINHVTTDEATHRTTSSKEYWLSPFVKVVNGRKVLTR